MLKEEGRGGGGGGGAEGGEGEHTDPSYKATAYYSHLGPIM